MGDVLTIGSARWRRGAALALLLISLVLLAACGGSGGGSQPFAKKLEGTPGPTGKTVPPIALTDVTGLPPEKLAQLKDALAIAAGKRDMAIVDSKVDSTTLTLTGSFNVTPDPSGVKLAYDWTLSDPAGTVLHTVSAEEVAPGSAAGDQWLQVTPAVMQRIAAYTAESLSSRLSQLGYATEIGGIPPPLETYAEAGPDADKDIDLETLYGPDKVPAELAAAQNPGPDKPPAAAAGERSEGKVVAAAAKPATADASARKQISAVAVLPVSGAPGRGNDDLTKAMRQTLTEAGWPVLTKPRDDALTIMGHVKVGAKKAQSQTVALAWTVKTPDGRTLGTVKQANTVPAGSLEGGFGQNAVFAAQAAAGGIFELVKKYR